MVARLVGVRWSMVLRGRVGWLVGMEACYGGWAVKRWGLWVFAGLDGRSCGGTEV